MGEITAYFMLMRMIHDRRRTQDGRERGKIDGNKILGSVRGGAYCTVHP